MQEPKQIRAHPKEVSDRLAARAISFEIGGRLGMAIEKAGAIADCQQLELEEEITSVLTMEATGLQAQRTKK
jgi:hypothetical protein